MFFLEWVVGYSIMNAEVESRCIGEDGSFSFRGVEEFSQNDLVTHDLHFLTPLILRIGRQSFEEIQRKSHRFDGAFIAHNSERKRLAVVRLGKVYAFDKEISPTGFERYFIGSDLSAEDIVRRQVEIGRNMTLGIERYARYVPYVQGDPLRTAASMLKTARGDAFSLQALPGLNAVYGAEVAKLRARRTASPLSPMILEKTDELVRRLGGVEYDVTGDTLSDMYYLPKVSMNPHRVWQVALTKEEYNAYALVREIGRVGHPLIRQLIHEGI